MTTFSRRDTLRMLGATPLLATPALLSAPSAGAAEPTATCFTMFDNTAYEKSGGDDGDPDVSAYLGIQESSIVYTETWNSYFLNPPYDVTPIENAFKTRVATESRNRPGPVVIDAEVIFFKDYPNVYTPPDKKVEIWTKLLTWAKSASGGKRVGAYAFTSGATSNYFSYAKEVVRLMDAWFSYGYYSASWTMFSEWTSRENTYNSISRKLEDLAVVSERPIYVYMWPNYSPGTDPDIFIPRTLWRDMLNWTNNNSEMSGAVLWSSSGTPEIKDRGWLDETKLFLDANGC